MPRESNDVAGLADGGLTQITVRKDADLMVRLEFDRRDPVRPGSGQKWVVWLDPAAAAYLAGVLAAKAGVKIGLKMGVE